MKLATSAEGLSLSSENNYLDINMKFYFKDIVVGRYKYYTWNVLGD